MRSKFWLLLTTAMFLSATSLVFAEKNPKLPPPFATPSIQNFSKVIGWPEGVTPKAPAGFTVSEFARLETPRFLYRLPNGDILVSQATKHPDDQGEQSPNLITRFHMNGSKLVSTSIFAQGLDLPSGMALWKDQFFVATPKQILKYKYVNGALVGEPTVIAELPFPAPQRHWTRFLIINGNGTKLYVSVGSVSNVGESPDPLNPENAAILEMNLDGSGKKVLVSGIRNAVTMAWEPTTGALWACVNERDELGDELVPDYITRLKKGGFYGWPYSYWGKHPDPRLNGAHPELVAKAITPDFSVGPHTASLGITFTQNTLLPMPWNHGALISQHGSWNSSSLRGYKVLYVPFVNGNAVDGEKDFLTGFIADGSNSTVYGRPVSSVILSDGSVLVADDAGGRVWKVSKAR